MKRGDKVLTAYGDIETVLKVTDCSVYVYGGRWYHPTKVWRLAK